MGQRLTQIATRTGDNGTTGLGDNTRVSKDSRRVHAMGDVDELNSNIGVLLCEDMPADVHDVLVEVQHQLFNLGGELSIPGFELLKPEALLQLERVGLGDKPFELAGNLPLGNQRILEIARALAADPALDLASDAPSGPRCISS